MLTMAIPPRIQPTQAMVMKKGTAIRLKEEMPLTICWHRVWKLRPWTPRQKMVDSATA